MKQLTYGAFFSGVFSAELPECMQEIMTEKTKDYYQHFLPISEEKWQSDDFIAYLFKQLGKFLWLWKYKTMAEGCGFCYVDQEVSSIHWFSL